MTWQQLKQAAARRLFGDVIRQAVAEARQTFPVSFGQDPAVVGFRRLTGSGQDNPRDLPIVTQERSQQIAYFLYLQNPFAQWWVDTKTTYIVGAGVTLKADDEAAQTLVDSWWTDPVNNWPLKLESKVRELSLYGEQCWPVFVNQISGRVRLGYLDPFWIDEVVLDPDNAEQAIGVVSKRLEGPMEVPSRRYKTILAISDDELTPRARQLREQFTDGECFYYAVNKVSNGSRGISDLLAKADWFDGHEQFMFQRLERSDMANRVVTDITLTGATAAEVETYRKNFVLPKPGGAHIHNDKVKMEAVAPNLQATDAEVDARLFRNMCIAPMPEHWFGGGGNVNRATAQVMDEPTYKNFEARQKHVKAIIEDGARYAIRQAKAHGALPQDAPETVQAIFPNMVQADISDLSTALNSAATAVTAARTEGLISKSEGRRILAVVVKPLGVELAEKTDEELAQMAADEALRHDAQDYQGDPVAKTRDTPPPGEAMKLKQVR